jgi:type 1 fimbria pilin
MKNVLIQFPLLMVLLTALTPFSAKAETTAELKVKGSIRPPGCTPTLTAGGTADYGVIPMKTLNQNSLTSLGEKTVGFSISCTAKIKVGLAATDNRKASVISGAPIGAFGLGTSSGKNIGYYSAYFDPDTATGDGVSVSVLLYNPGGGGGNFTDSNGNTTSLPVTAPSWGSTGSGNIGRGNLAFSSSGNAPQAYQTISGRFLIYTTIDRAANLPSSQDIPLDGSATIEVQYL